jgi:hypothetical protein
MTIAAIKGAVEKDMLEYDLLYKTTRLLQTLQTSVAFVCKGLSD